MITYFKVLSLGRNFFVKSIIFLFFFFTSFQTFSQGIGQGELLNEKTLELAISANRKINPSDSYKNLYSNYTVVLDLAQAKVNSELIVKLTKSIDGVLECTYDSTSGILAASTKKMKNNIFESQIKEIINQEGYVKLSITELIYKSE